MFGPPDAYWILASSPCKDGRGTMYSGTQLYCKVLDFVPDELGWGVLYIAFKNTQRVLMQQAEHLVDPRPCAIQWQVFAWYDD